MARAGTIGTFTYTIMQTYSDLCPIPLVIAVPALLADVVSDEGFKTERPSWKRAIEDLKPYVHNLSDNLARII